MKIVVQWAAVVIGVGGLQPLSRRIGNLRTRGEIGRVVALERIRIVKAFARIDSKWTPFLCAKDGVNAPALSYELRNSVELRHVINQGKVDVPWCIKVGRRIVLVDVVRILIVRQEVAAAVRGAG